MGAARAYVKTVAGAATVGSATVLCNGTDVATGGGASSATGHLTYTFPVGGGTTSPPNGWQGQAEAVGTNPAPAALTVYVVCIPR